MMHIQSTSPAFSSNNLSKTKTILFFGASCSGKTSLLLQLTKNRFDEEYQTTIGVNYYFKEMAVVTLSLWDTRGSEISEGFLPKHLFTSASCFIIVLSYDDIDSLNEAILYIDFIKSQCDVDHTSTTVFNSYKPIIALINKKDVKDKQFKRGEAIVALRETCPNILIGEITAKDGVMVKRFFEKVETLLLFGKVRRSRGEGNDDNDDDDNNEEEGDDLLMVASTFQINDKQGNDTNNNDNDKKRSKKKKCCNNN